MTLAVFFLLGIFFSEAVHIPEAAALPVQQPSQAAPAAQSVSPPSPAPTPADQSQSSSTAKPSSNSPATSPSNKTRAKKGGCRLNPPSNHGGSGPGATGSSSTATAPSKTSGGKTNGCPPAKVVVRQGGSSEPAIQLAGGSGGGQASQERATANQMLESTEENLKKLEGQPMSATEQDMITQIRQYMDQSKSAVAAGDMDRARTLAWKAQTLSEDLTNPKK